MLLPIPGCLYLPTSLIFFWSISIYCFISSPYSPLSFTSFFLLPNSFLQHSNSSATKLNASTIGEIRQITHFIRICDPSRDYNCYVEKSSDLCHRLKVQYFILRLIRFHDTHWQRLIMLKKCTYEVFIEI